MKIFYVIYIKDKLLRTIIDGIRILADPFEKQKAHITVRGPYYQSYHLSEKNEIIKHTRISIHGIGTFFNATQNTIFLKVKQTSEALKNVWKKDFYKDSFNPHLTIFDGTNKEFADKLLRILYKYSNNFAFEFEVRELEPLISSKKQVNNNFVIDYDFNLLSTFLKEKIDLEKIKRLSESERLKRIEELSKHFLQLEKGKGISSNFENLFEKLDYTTENGLFYYSDKKKWNHIFPYRIARALTEIKPYAFFSLLRKTQNGNLNGNHPHSFNEPLILFFSDYLFENQDEEEIHRKVFSLGKAPVVFIEKENEIYIYNGLHFEKNSKKRLEIIEDFENVENFSFNKLIGGETWNKYYKNHFKGKPRVDDYLLANISEARVVLMIKGLTSKIANALLGRLIFNRYLIDRGVEISQKYIPGKNKGERNLSFLNLINKKIRLYEYFNYFNEHFRGELFPITPEEITKVNEDHLGTLHKLFEGGKFHKDSYQPSFFDVYDFQIIPIELISNIYERFLGKEKQDKTKSFYTPPFLVDYVLSQTIQPFINDNDSTTCKVLDPSCGSGIFLIETLRKLIENYLHKKNERVIKNNRILWKIITDNIFGIDIDPDAIDVAIFSLYITILDYKEPKDIKKIRFHPLKNKNFYCADFFDTKHLFNKTFEKVKLNFLIGNPPWGKIESSNYENYCHDRELKEKKRNKAGENFEIGLSDKQIAQAFIIRVSDFEISDKCAFLITSKILYNNNGKTWRKYFLNNFFIEQVFELSPVRKEIFDEAIWPSAILFFRSIKPEKKQGRYKNIVHHISLKPNKFFQYFKTIVIEKYDYKKIPQRDFMDDHGGADWLWKIFLYGNRFDYYFISRLKNNFPSIQQIVSKYNLQSAGGLKLVDGNKKQSAENIIGFDYLDIGKQEFKPFSLNPNAKWQKRIVGYVPEKYFFIGAKLLIKKGLTTDFKAVAAYSNRNIVFTDSVNSIKPDKSATIFNLNYNLVLKSLVGLFNSELFSYFIFHTGSSPGVDKPRAYFSEHFAFPAIIDEKISKVVDEIQSSYSEQKEILFQDEGKIKQLEQKLNLLIFKLYKVNDDELSLIKYTREVLIPIVNRETHIFQPANDSLLKEYIDQFFKKNETPYMVTVYKHTEFIAINFENSVNKKNCVEIIKLNNKNEITSFIKNLSIIELTTKLYIQKDIKGINKNSIFIIKPNERKCWHPAIAISDIEDFNFRSELPTWFMPIKNKNAPMSVAKY